MNKNRLEERILDLLGKDLMSTSELARKIGIRRDLIAGYLEALRDQGKVKFFKVGRAYVYTLRGKK